MLNTKYTEIKALFRYCRKTGIDCAIMPFKDGYKIVFPNGGDVVQHSGSYEADNGCVEFAIGSRADYKATALRNAKQIVRRNKGKTCVMYKNREAPAKKGMTENA